MQHYFLDDQLLKLDQQLTLPAYINKHWLKVLRANEGDSAEFVDQSGQVFLGELINKDPAQITIKKSLNRDAEMPNKITLACGLPKGSKADLIVRKGTEMGASKIIFLPTDWSIAKWKGNRIEKKLTRLNNIALSAAEQSKRNLVPKVEYMHSLNELMQSSFDQKMVAYEESAKEGETTKLKQIMDTYPKGANLLAFFGPEGGVSPKEVELLKNNHFETIGLGPRILRTETAPLYFLAVVSAFTELEK